MTVISSSNRPGNQTSAWRGNNTGLWNITREKNARATAHDRTWTSGAVKWNNNIVFLDSPWSSPCYPTPAVKCAALGWSLLGKGRCIIITLLFLLPTHCWATRDENGSGSDDTVTIVPKSTKWPNGNASCDNWNHFPTFKRKKKLVLKSVDYPHRREYWFWTDAPPLRFIFPVLWEVKIEFTWSVCWCRQKVSAAVTQ